MVWLPTEPGDRPALQLEPRSKEFEKLSSRATVWGAIAPLYPKLRLTAEDLIAYAGDFLPLMVDTASRCFRATRAWWTRSGPRWRRSPARAGWRRRAPSWCEGSSR